MEDAATAPAQRYRGTDIDGVSIEPDRLEIRGRSVTDLIGHLNFAQAALFVLDDPGSDAATLDDAMAEVLALIGPDHPAARIAELAAGAGADLPERRDGGSLCHWKIRGGSAARGASAPAARGGAGACRLCFCASPDRRMAAGARGLPVARHWALVLSRRHARFAARMPLLRQRIWRCSRMCWWAGWAASAPCRLRS